MRCAQRRDTSAVWKPPVAHGRVLTWPTMTTALWPCRRFSWPAARVRSGAAFVRTGETGVVVDRLPPGRQCAETEEELRDRAVAQFDSDRIMDSIIAAVNTVRLGRGITTAASV